MLKVFQNLLMWLAVTPLWVMASDSFRLDNGDLIYVGMSKPELIAAAGQPMHTENVVTRNQFGEVVQSDFQMLTYQLTGSIGGEYSVSIKMRKGAVSELEVIQLKR